MPSVRILEASVKAGKHITLASVENHTIGSKGGKIVKSQTMIDFALLIIRKENTSVFISVSARGARGLQEAYTKAGRMDRTRKR